MSRPSRGWGVRLAPWLGNGQIWNGEHFANYTSNRWCRKCVIFFFLLCRNKNAVLLRMSLIDLNVGLRYFGCVNFVFRCCPNPLPSPLVGAVRLGHVPNRSRLCGLCGDAGRGWVRMMSLRGGWRRAPSRSCSLQLCLTAWVACARELWQHQKQNEGGSAGLSLEDGSGLRPGRHLTIFTCSEAGWLCTRRAC